ncbi:MAG: hypothetical protein V4537_14295 [Pseudomonadota bacterium]
MPESMSPSDPRHRYRNNVAFRNLVDFLRRFLREAQSTPSELREALLLAAYLEEMENPTPAYFRMREFADDLISEMPPPRRKRPPL